MRITALLGSAAILLASTGASDPIGQVIAQYDASPMWMNGIFPVIELPANASDEQVVAKAFAMSGFSGKGKDYRIMSKRQVRIDGVPYRAALIQTGHQGAVVLFKYEGTSWWSRIVPVASDKMPSSTH